LQIVIVVDHGLCGGSNACQNKNRSVARAARYCSCSPSVLARIFDVLAA